MVFNRFLWFRLFISACQRYLLRLRHVLVDVAKKMLPIFSLVGDSNLRRHVSPLSCREVHMSGAQISTCGRIEALAEVLRGTRSESTVVVVACITNFLTSSEEISTSVGLRVGPVLSSFREVILDFCQEQPERYLSSYSCLFSVILHLL